MYLEPPPELYIRKTHPDIQYLILGLTELWIIGLGGWFFLIKLFVQFQLKGGL